MRRIATVVCRVVVAVAVMAARPAGAQVPGADSPCPLASDQLAMP
jgi:hypothetical protein